MWNKTYTQQQLEQADEAICLIMRARYIQEVINIVIPDDPPRNKLEYEQAGQIFIKRILSCQPLMANQNVSPQEAYHVIHPLFPPLTLIGHHVRVAVLNIALGHYRNGLGYIVSMQETACQFGDDNILINAAKLGFAISSLVIPEKCEAETLFEAALICQVPLIKKDEPCVHNHGEATRHLCVNFYEILVDFATMNNGNRKYTMNAASLVAIHLHLLGNAGEIDKVTKNKFRMKEWVNATVKQLGYDTGV